MKKTCKIPLIALLSAVIFFAGTFTVYILNLDMKLLSAIEPFFLKHYDKIPRKQSL